MNETGKAARSSVEGEASGSTTPAADGSDTAAVVFDFGADQKLFLAWEFDRHLCRKAVR